MRERLIGTDYRTIVKRLLLVAACVSLPLIAWAQWTTSSTDIYNSNSGNVGIGTASWTAYGARLAVHYNSAGDQIMTLRNTNSAGLSSIRLEDNNGSYVGDIGYYNLSGYEGIRIGGNSSVNTYFPTGNVGIGTTSPSSKLDVDGDVTVSGNISAKYQDLAEWVSTPHVLATGTVVALDVESDNGIVPSSIPYDIHVAGVVSDSPGIILGQAGPGKLKIATTGRVKVHVDTSNGPIRRGDLLVTGTKEGTAMRSEAVNFGGVEFHRPGTLIGKALEPLENGEGEILVLLSLH